MVGIIVTRCSPPDQVLVQIVRVDLLGRQVDGLFDGEREHIGLLAKW